MDKKIVLARAKELLKSNPTFGKNRINAQLRKEYGIGLRSETMLQLKRDVASENPKLVPYLYNKGGVSPKLSEIYNSWRASGFLPFEARELTIGHRDVFNAKMVFDSVPAQRAREFRMQIIKEQRDMGWTDKQIKDNILDYYMKSKKASPWEHIRAEYKPRKKVDFIDYKEMVRRRAKAKQQRLLRKAR